MLWAAVAALLGCATPGTDKLSLAVLVEPGHQQPIIAQLTPGKFDPSLLTVGSERDLAQQRGRHLGFVPNAGIESYLSGIHRRLLTVSGQTKVPGTIQMTADTAYSAYATADGNIFISMAWLPDVESEDELAAIVAHELAHILLKHQSSNLVGLTQKRLQTGHQMLLASRQAGQSTVPLGRNDQNALLAAQLAVGVIDKVVMPAWNRRQENEADLLGIDLLIRAGYSPEGMGKMLERLRDWEQKNMQATEALQKRVKDQQTKNLDAAVKNALNTLLQELAREHPDTDLRLDNTAVYLERHYAANALPDLTVKSLKTFRSNRQIAPVLINYQHAVRAKRLLQAGQAKAAYEQALLGARPPTDKDAMPNWILWQTAKGVGRQQAHQKTLQQALNAREPVIEIYREAIATAEQARKYDAALKLLDEAERKFGNSPEWMPDRIRLLTRLGRKTEASALALRCTIESPLLRDECLNAGKS